MTVEEVLGIIEDFCLQEITEEQSKRFSGYTHADCGYEEAQSDLMDVVEEIRKRIAKEKEV